MGEYADMEIDRLLALDFSMAPFRVARPRRMYPIRCNKCGETILWRRAGGVWLPVNVDGTEHLPTCTGRAATDDDFPDLSQKRYRIRYKDPDTEEIEELEGAYDDRLHAEDHAYALADKGWYEIKELP